MFPTYSICKPLHTIEVPGAKPVESEELSLAYNINIYVLTCAYMLPIHAFSRKTLPCRTQDPDKEEAPELAIDDMDDEPIIIDVKDPNIVCSHMT